MNCQRATPRQNVHPFKSFRGQTTKTLAWVCAQSHAHSIYCFVFSWFRIRYFISFWGLVEVYVNPCVYVCLTLHRYGQGTMLNYLTPWRSKAISRMTSFRWDPLWVLMSLHMSHAATNKWIELSSLLVDCIFDWVRVVLKVWNRLSVLGGSKFAERNQSKCWVHLSRKTNAWFGNIRIRQPCRYHWPGNEM